MPGDEEAPSFDLVIVGHITIDRIVIGNKSHYEMGGPPAYAMVAPALGMEHAAIVSRIGADFPQEYFQELRSSGLNLSGVLPTLKNTLFENRYDAKGNRTQQAPHVADPIMRSDIPSSHWNTSWMHLSPVLREVDSRIIPAAKRKEINVSVDVQGFIRNRKSPRTPDIIPCSWEEFPEIACKIDVLKADVNEICQLTQQPSFQDAANHVHDVGCPLIIITQGQRGSFIYLEDSVHEVPAIPSQTIVDFTGSGDVFGISFLFEFERTGRPLWAAFFASTVASFNIETPGPTGFPNAGAVTKRLNQFLHLPGNRNHLKLLLEEPGPGECPISLE